jgi:hypothetical protein
MKTYKEYKTPSKFCLGKDEKVYGFKDNVMEINNIINYDENDSYSD